MLFVNFSVWVADKTWVSVFAGGTKSSVSLAIRCPFMAAGWRFSICAANASLQPCSRLPACPKAGVEEEMLGNGEKRECGIAGAIRSARKRRNRVQSMWRCVEGFGRSAGAVQLTWENECWRACFMFVGLAHFNWDVHFKKPEWFVWCFWNSHSGQILWTFLNFEVKYSYVMKFNERVRSVIRCKQLIIACFALISLTSSH